MDEKWEVEIWQTDNGRWRWALYRDGEQVWMGNKSEKTKTGALDAAKVQKALMEGSEQRERISLD